MNSNGEGRLPPGVRLTERVERKRGLRPRDAALFIVTVWLLAVVIFGVTEYLVDPTTFPTPWLGM